MLKDHLSVQDLPKFFSSLNPGEVQDKKDCKFCQQNMNDTRNYIKIIIKLNPCLADKLFLAKVYEAAAFTGSIEILTAGTSGTVTLSID